MQDVVTHKFDLYFHALNTDAWMNELQDLVPSGWLMTSSTSLRHIVILCPQKNVDLVRISVEKLSQHIQQVTGSTVTSFESIGWGTTYEDNPHAP